MIIAIKEILIGRMSLRKKACLIDQTKFADFIVDLFLCIPFLI